MQRIRRAMLIRSGLALAIVLLLLLLSPALPLRTWRTGEAPAPALPTRPGDAFGEIPRRLWIDSDAACGVGERTDPDDCLAIMMLLRDPRFTIAGVSATFGNAALGQTFSTLNRLVRLLEEETGRSFPTYLGSAAPIADGAVPSRGPAHDALKQALHEGPLSIISLGPLTNIAVSLEGEADLQRQVSRLIVVMGRRPDHLFHPSEGKAKEAILFGHGPIFRDFNLAMDPEAGAKVIAMGLPLTAVPYEVSRLVLITEGDLGAIAGSGPAGGFVASGSRPWLAYWQREIGLPGFYPFDAIAALYFIQPGVFGCAEARAWIDRGEALLRWLGLMPALFVGRPEDSPKTATAATAISYCSDLRQPQGHDTLVEAATRDAVTALRSKSQQEH